MTGVRRIGFAGYRRAWREQLGHTEIALRRGREEVVFCVLVRNKLYNLVANAAFLQSLCADKNRGHWPVVLAPPGPGVSWLQLSCN